MSNMTQPHNPTMLDRLRRGFDLPPISYLPTCPWCDEPVEPSDPVITIPHYDGDSFSVRHWHRACSIRSHVGGYNHLRGDCTCQGGTLPPDPAELTKRAAAVLAAVEWQIQRQRKRALDAGLPDPIANPDDPEWASRAQVEITAAVRHRPGKGSSSD